MPESAAVQQPASAAEERHKLTALEGLAALSLDALSSVAYGPQAIIIVLATAGLAALERYTLPVTLARPWQRLLHNQRGFVLEQAIQRGAPNVVICRLRYRLDLISSGSG